MFWFFGWEAYEIIDPRPGIELIPSVLEGEVLTTGPPGKSSKGFIEHFSYGKKDLFTHYIFLLLGSYEFLLFNLTYGHILNPTYYF